MKHPTVTLVSWSPDPIALIWLLWEQSKSEGPVPMSIEEVRATVTVEKLEALFWRVLNQHIPIAEHIHLTFVLDGISISWREQAVRHRIGTRVGDQLGVDIIPDLASSSWWSQSMRIMDMSTFADREAYRVPETLAGVRVPRASAFRSDDSVSAEALFKSTMDQIQLAYYRLVQAGVPMEDARELIPLGATHRMSWDLNLASLLHIVGKRGCWILQAGIWAPIIEGMVRELAAKVHPMFRTLVRPPCVGDDDKFKACAYQEENKRRMTEDDKLPPCPLWLVRDPEGQREMDESIEHSDGDPAYRELWNNHTPLKTVEARRDILISAHSLVPRHREMKARAPEYQRLWDHDPFVWDKLAPAEAALRRVLDSGIARHATDKEAEPVIAKMAEGIRADVDDKLFNKD